MIKLALLFLLIFVSCTEKHNMEDIYFKEATEIKGEKLPEEYLTSFSFCGYYTSCFWKMLLLFSTWQKGMRKTMPGKLLEFAVTINEFADFVSIENLGQYRIR